MVIPCVIAHPENKKRHISLKLQVRAMCLASGSNVMVFITFVTYLYRLLLSFGSSIIAHTPMALLYKQINALDLDGHICHALLTCFAVYIFRQL